MRTHDAIVVGAGPAGCAAAIELARAGRSVALVEKAVFPRRKVCGEFLSATSIPVLERLGIAAAWRDLAGPEVRRVALFAGERVIEAPMPGEAGYGRALGRDVLDALMRDAAARLGVDVMQPGRAEAHGIVDGLHRLDVAMPDGPVSLAAPAMVAAHGSWERAAIPCPPPRSREPGDMLGFKAHFHGGTMGADLMPLLSFPGGYGGMVWADGGRLSLSCCVRRDRLEALRRSGEPAAAAVHRHLLASCRGIREAIGEAALDGPWLSAGPLRPGIRPRHAADVFRVGNVAGEAHPVIAEGISMAVQSGWLLGRELAGIDLADPTARAAAGARYARAWRRQFAGRIRAAGLFARLAMRPEAFESLGGVLAAAPALLTLGARLSGKAKPLVGSHGPAGAARTT